MSFLKLYDNSNFLKVNFISDDAIAADMNVRNLANGFPAATSPSLMGGYCYPILQNIVDQFSPGSTYQILKCALPKEDPKKHDFIIKLIGQAETLYAYVDSGEITIVQIEGWNRSARSLSSMNWNVFNGPKTFKRLKTLNRPFRLWSIDNRPLRVAIIEDDDYTEEFLEGYSEAEVERLLDGAIVISPSLFQDCLGNVKFPEFVQDDEHPEFAVDFYRAQEYLQQAQNFHAFNARIFGPMVFVGLNHEDELYDRPGMLKAEAFVDVSGTLDKMHVDVICARSALKFEVANSTQRVVLLEPQKAKLSGVSSDLQTMINLPALFQPHDTAQWTRDFLLANFERLRKNEIMESWFDMATPYFNASTRVFSQNDVLTLTKWNARAWLMSGLRITDSPWLFEQLGSAIAKTLRSQDHQKLRFPIPCAVRAQCISASFASMAGSDMQVQQGCARWNSELEAIVVNDIDWLEMYRSHGGMDLDDFFVGYWRTVGNLRKIILVRSPNDWGEYTTFDYVEGDWYPQMETHDGKFILFPQVSDDPELWPKRLSEAYSENSIIYTGLPSELDKTPIDVHPYNMDDVKFAIDNNQSSETCVGANVNARSLWALTMRKHRTVQLTTMESCIDTGTQGGSQEDIQAVHAEAKSIVDDIVSSSNPIDSYMWFTRFANFNASVHPSRLTSNTHISKAHQFRLDAAKAFNKMVRDYAQTHLTQNLNPVIHTLGKKHLVLAYEAIVKTRKNMYQMQSGTEDALKPNAWQDVHSLILTKIHEFDDEVDKFDFVLGLYSASFKAKTTSSGRVTDQLVMNPHIFPYLLNALRFYGLAFYINVEDGRIVRNKVSNWSLACKECGEVTETENPLILQTYHTHEGICKVCRSK
jgi:hypothetical protein